MGRTRYRFLSHQPHFLTCTIVNWLALFSKPELVQIILNSLNFLQAQQRLSIHGYVIMENHLHWIASAPTLAKEIANFKCFYSPLYDRLVGGVIEDAEVEPLGWGSKAEPRNEEMRKFSYFTPNVN
jgi:REP element-mobilizing transposase RayT